MEKNTFEGLKKKISPADRSRDSSSFSIKEVDGQWIEVAHPVILSQMPSDRTLHDHEAVTMFNLEFKRPEKATFDDYLALLDVKYNQYFAAAQAIKHEQGSIDHQTLLLTLHKKSVDRRTEITKRLHEMFSAEVPWKDNLQRESKMHDMMYCKMIKELGIEGITAIEARPREDYLDQVDWYIVIEPDKIEGREESRTTEPHKYYFGMQASFNDEAETIRHDHWRTIRERLEAGRIPRIFYQLKFKECGLDADGRGQSLADRYVRMHAENAAKKGFALDGAPFEPVAAVLGKTIGEGYDEQYRRALDIFATIKRELEQYVRIDTDEKDRENIQRRIRVIDMALKKIEEENR